MTVDPINKFVFGIKGLELWNNMACWILREDQNKDTGVTVYSLGGLSASNMPHGTLGTTGAPIGLPIRTTNGVQFTGIQINQENWPQNYITTGSFTFNLSCTLYSVINLDFAGSGTYSYVLTAEAVAVNPVIMNIFPSNPNPFYHFLKRIGLYRRAQTPGSLPIVPNDNRYGSGLGPYGPAQVFQQSGPIGLDDNNNWAAVGMSYLSGNQLYSRNGGNFTNGTIKPIFPILREDNIMLISTIQRPVDGFRGIGAAYFYFNKFLDQREHTKLYTLYKETLGDGLGLP